MLWACLLLPSLSLDVFARVTAPGDARPLVISSGGHYPRVVTANAGARLAGITNDQLISAVLALAPDVVLRDRDGVAEQQALAEVATALLTFTPNVSIALPNAVMAEISGSLRLFGGLAPLLEQLEHRVRVGGYAVQRALAPTPAAALALARAGETTPVVNVDELPGALAPLPLVLLDLDAETLATLKSAGVSTVGGALALPRAGLARRFDQRVVDTIDRALGRMPDPRPSYRPPAVFERRLALPAPVDSVEALQFGVNRLVGDLAGWLLARGLGIVRMSLMLIHERYIRDRGIPPTIATFKLGAPARAPAHLHAVLRERLARVTLPAPVEAIALCSDDTAPLAGRNLGLLPEDEADAVVVPLVDRLRSRLGDAAVSVLRTHAEHRPEYASSEALPAADPRTHASGPATARASPKTASGRPAAHARARGGQPPRPLWLLDEAQPLGNILEARPWILRDGPERIESGWWDGRDFRRDYFVAEKPDGGLVWIYRDHRYGTDDGEWFMHGHFA
jgi:protein ImuB